MNEPNHAQASTISTPSTTRFSDRVANYVRYRPHYPDELSQALKELGFKQGRMVADIGSGTGISTQLILNLGCSVYAVEPNGPMREAAETKLGNDDQFHSVDGTAESTTLPTQNFDAVAVGQAFHWFDQSAAKREFQRILKPNGTVALFWNVRQTDTSPFLEAYEQLLIDYATDYQKVDHRNVDADVVAKFFGKPVAVRSFPNQQKFDFDGLKGRLLSSSYAPNKGHPSYDPMIAKLTDIFSRFSQDNAVYFDYHSELFAAQFVTC